MRHFIIDNQLFDVRDGQYTADEIKDQGLSKTPCAPSGAVDVTDYADDIKTYSATHTPSLVDGELVWTEKVVELTVQQQIDELEASISARRWREAYLGDEDAAAFIADVNSQIEELRDLL